jgi:hypothetical protein
VACGIGASPAPLMKMTSLSAALSSGNRSHRRSCGLLLAMS